jgi:transposase-like protein
LGFKKIPAVVVQGSFSETEKVQQFLVENVARLKMKPVDRALLIAHARASGEETKSLAKRFGVSATTVRKLESQLGGASDAEIAALRRGDVTLAMQSVIARVVRDDEREHVVNVVAGSRLTSVDLQTLLLALGWQKLMKLGKSHRESRMALLEWACARLAEIPKGSFKSRMAQLAVDLPDALDQSTRLRRNVI